MRRVLFLLLALVPCLAMAQASGPSRAAPAEASEKASSPQTAPEPESDSAREGREEREGRDQRRARRTPRAFKIEWNVPQPLRGLFEKHLVPPEAQPGQRGTGRRAWMREMRRRIPEIAATEGFFSPAVKLEADEEDRDVVEVVVEPGPRTMVRNIEIAFEGDLAGESADRAARREALRSAWAMKAGQTFRGADWEAAKTRLHEALTAEDYAAGIIARSEARVDAEAAAADLTLVLDSGPRFTLGDIRIHGIDNYSEAVVRRIVDIRRGERYSQERLTQLQRSVQNGPWFASVVVEVERDRAKPELVDINMLVTERPRREIGMALGYGTDDGARAEVAFRHRDLLDRGFDLQSSLRAAQERQIGYVDVYMPPGLFPLPFRGDTPFQDSVGVLAERSTIEKLKLARFAVAGYRHFRLDTWELRGGLSYQIERKTPEGADTRITRALAPIVSATWRRVDDLFDPRRGVVVNLQAATATKSLASSQDFFKLYGQAQFWVPITRDDQLLFRTELGTTFASSREGIPEDFLYRAGGSRSNRGYSFQSLGAREGEAVVGGRYIATGTVEYVRWLNERWGAAVFTDIGDAADTRSEWNANPSYGIGARFKTPAGPFALDLAYAQEAKRLRLSFSVTVAF